MLKQIKMCYQNIVLVGIYLSVAPQTLLYAQTTTEEQTLENSEENYEYRQAILYIQNITQQGKKTITNENFQNLNWLGRIAAINYLCSVGSRETCKNVLKLGTQNRALVVRDHALRIIFASPYYSNEEKRNIATETIKNEQNYRRGVPLWIVLRAQNYLQTQAEEFK